MTCVLCQVAVPGWDSPDGAAVHFRLNDKNLWEGDRKREPWQLAPVEEPDNPRISVQEKFKKEHYQRDPQEKWEERPELMNRKKRPPPEEWSHRGERPWTNVDPTGSECNSSAVHILGFALNYATVPEFNKGANQKKKMIGFVDWETSLEPPLGRPPPGGVWECVQSRRRQVSATSKSAASTE